MSFKEKATLMGSSKADKLFGVAKVDNSLAPQKAGWLHKKESTTLSTLTTGGWKKRWFCVKDSFLFYYDYEVKDLRHFDSKPRCSVPLGGASIKLLADKVSLELSHEVFGSSESWLLRAEDPIEASEWVAIIKVGMGATWENAILGYALIEKMNAKGTSLEKEKEEALNAAQENARRVAIEREDASKLAERKLLEAEELRSQKDKVQAQVGALQQQVSMAGEVFAKEVEDTQEEKNRRQALEEELEEVQAALLELGAAMQLLQQKEAAAAAAAPPPAAPRRQSFLSRLMPEKKPEEPTAAASAAAAQQSSGDVMHQVQKLRQYFEERNLKVQEEKRRMAPRR